MTSVRGTIVKPPDKSPGLVSVDGQQRSFLLAGVWSSDRAPLPNMPVNVELNRSGAIVGTAPLDRQKLARERLDRCAKALRNWAKCIVRAMRRGLAQ
jgi:hypothetical protein